MNAVYTQYTATKFLGRFFKGEIRKSYRSTVEKDGLVLLLWTTVFDRCIEEVVYSNGNPSEETIKGFIEICKFKM
jgi:hypothetical protein